MKNLQTLRDKLLEKHQVNFLKKIEQMTDIQLDTEIARLKKLTTNESADSQDDKILQEKIHYLEIIIAEETA